MAYSLEEELKFRKIWKHQTYEPPELPSKEEVEKVFVNDFFREGLRKPTEELEAKVKEGVVVCEELMDKYFQKKKEVKVVKVA